jgi:molybdopterin-guanine dinucleotide biosynthesis protein A
MTDTPKDVERWFMKAIAKLWPVAEGSLSLRRSPCVRENCQACARGEGHPSYVLYARRDERRVSIYVPEDLAPKIEEAVENGRRLQQLMNEAGVRYVEAVKRQRARPSRKR